MGYKIEVDGLGPVKNAYISSSNNAIIAGPNGSGKSTVARVLYTSIYLNSKENEIKSQLEQGLREELINSMYDLYKAVYFDSSVKEIKSKFLESYLYLITYDEEFPITNQKEVINLFYTNKEHDKFTSNTDDYYDIRSELADISYILNCFFVTDNDYLIKVSRMHLNDLYNKHSGLIDKDNHSDESWEIIEKYKRVKTNIEDISIKVERLFEEGNIQKYFMKANFDNESFNVKSFEASHYDNIYFFDLESKYFKYDSLFLRKNAFLNILGKKSADIKYRDFESIKYFDFKIQRLNELVELFGLVSAKKAAHSNVGFDFGLTNVDGLVKETNLSSGQKMVYAITILIYDLSKKLVNSNKKTIIFIDEPELHLHPMLQLYFGEFLALASREFNIDFILITHSLYIIDAFNVFSKKYNNNLSFLDVYVMKEDKKYFSCQKVDKLSEVYNVLLSPYDILDQIEEELSIEQV